MARLFARAQHKKRKLHGRNRTVPYRSLSRVPSPCARARLPGLPRLEPTRVSTLPAGLTRGMQNTGQWRGWPPVREGYSVQAGIPRRRPGRTDALFQYGSDRIGDAVHVRVIDARDVDTARLDHVDVEFLAQANHLFLRDAEEREHAALPRDEREVHRRLARRELVDEQLAQAVQAAAHLLELFDPLRAQRS